MMVYSSSENDLIIVRKPTKHYLYKKAAHWTLNKRSLVSSQAGERLFQSVRSRELQEMTTDIWSANRKALLDRVLAGDRWK